MTASSLSQPAAALFDEAIALHRDGALDDAAAKYGAALAAEPTHLGALQLLGLVHLQRGQLPEAAALLGRAIECGLDTPDGHYHYGVVLEASQRAAEATAAYRAALARNPQHLSALLALAAVLDGQGAFEEAAACCRRAAEAAPENTGAWTRLGQAMQRLGRAKEAIDAYGRALALDPQAAEAHNNLGVALSNAGEIEAAIASYRQALALRPSYAQAHNNLGVALGARGELDAATACFRQTIALDPAHIGARVNLGNALQRQGRYEDAMASYRAALARDPNCVEALSNLGAAFNSLGRPAEALAPCRQAIALRPDYVEAHNNLGVALSALAQYDEAAACFRRVIAAAPHNAEAHNNLGVALNDLGRAVEAVACHERAIALKPSDAEACNNLGAAWSALDQPEKARAAFESALRLRPGYAEALSNLALLCVAGNRHDEALAYYNEALRTQPDHAWVQFNAALSHLTLGDYSTGWEKYEWRWRTHKFMQQARDIREPLWQGEGIADKTILLHCEQGLGDTLQFLRYLPLVAARAGTVLLEVQPPLKPLLESVAGAARVIAAGEPLPHFDTYCPLMSLPRIFATDLATMPPPFADFPGARARHAAWEAQLVSHTSPRVGLAWGGSRSHKNDRRRSIPLQRLTPLRASGIRFVSLQKELRAGDVETLKAFPSIARLGERFADFADAAAAVSQLDLVITVDTAMAHLAGGLGVPCWVMLPFSADWRWLLDRADSPWYPSLRLFRQPAPGDWDSAVAEIAEALASHLSKTAS